MAFPKKCFRRKSCGNKLKTENGELLSYTAYRVAGVPAVTASRVDTTGIEVQLICDATTADRTRPIATTAAGAQRTAVDAARPSQPQR